MKNQITLMGGVVFMTMSLMFLSSCKKEEISKKQTVQSGNHEIGKPNFKFSTVAKIPGESPENGFVSITVSSNDEVFLKEYVTKLEQSKVVFEETVSTTDKKENIHPIMGESNVPVSLNFDWTNFSFNKEKGKMYQLKMTSQNSSKALVYYTALNGSDFNFGWGFAAVNIYNTYNYNNQGYNNATWYFHNGSNHSQDASFYRRTMSYHDNLEVRCFQYKYNNTSPYWGYVNDYFTINGIVTYYRPRFNYVSPEMPVDYMDVNAITHAFGGSNTNFYMPAPGAITLYIAG